MKKLLIIIVLGYLAGLPVYAQTNEPVNGSVDVTKPIISSVSISSITKNSSKISWTTNEISTSYVDFGPTDVYGNTLGDGTYTLTHEVALLGLTAETPYHFRIRSKDAAGNEAVSTDTTFTTLAATVNTNTSLNSNSSTNLNANKNTNTNANKNANVNLNANKNTNANKNVNSNKNLNTNANKNLNVSLDDSVGVNSNLNVNTNEDLTNADVLGLTDLNSNSNSESTGTSSSDGRTGLILIIGGVVLLIVIIIFAWKKLRGQSSFKP